MALKAISFGINEYALLSNINFCEEDAKGFSEVVQNFYQPSWNRIKLGGQLSFLLFQREIDNFISDLNSEDTLFFFYAGHGCNFNGRPFLSAYDSDSMKIAETFIDLYEIMAKVEKRECRRSLYFIDACHSTPKAGSRSAKVWNDLEIVDKLRISQKVKFCFALASCSESEQAFPDVDAKHGIWSHYLLKAMSGEAEEALDKKRALTCIGLQNYLNISVKEHYRLKNKIPKQTAHLWGKGETDFILNIFEEPEIILYEEVPKAVLSEVEFFTTKIKNVNELEGYDGSRGRKPIKLPVSPWAKSFMKEKSADDLNSWIKEVADNVVEKFKLKRKEYELEEAGTDGVATFSCKYFDYKIEANISNDDENSVKFSFVLEPKDQQAIYNYRDVLDECFPFWFDGMRYRFLGGSIDLENLIDVIEESSNEDFDLEYEKDLSEVTLTHVESNRRFIFTRNRLVLAFKGTEKLDQALDGLKLIANEVHKISSDLKLLEDNSKKKSKK